MLSEFRSRLIEGGVEQELFQLMLSRFQEKGLLKFPQKQRTDSTHILAAIRVLGRLENIGETQEIARVRKTTSEFKKQYATRAGVEGTISQGTRAKRLRRCRYRGFPKTRLQHIVTACALNVVRIWEWWTDAYTFGTTPSRFAAKRSLNRYHFDFPSTRLPCNTWLWLGLVPLSFNGQFQWRNKRNKADDYCPFCHTVQYSLSGREKNQFFFCLYYIDLRSDYFRQQNHNIR